MNFLGTSSLDDLGEVGWEQIGCCSVQYSFSPLLLQKIAFICSSTVPSNSNSNKNSNSNRYSNRNRNSNSNTILIGSCGGSAGGGGGIDGSVGTGGRGGSC